MTEINKSKEHGFSLVELLIVVLTIAIIAVIAIPNLLAARRAANEGSAISALRSLHSAQSTYQTANGAGNYAGTNAVAPDTVGLGLLAGANLIDPALGAGTKAGFNFAGAITLAGIGSPATFFFTANPVSSSGVTQSGTRRFAVTQTGQLGSDPTNIAVQFDRNTAPAAAGLN